MLLGVWQRWDTLWYTLIACRGYSLEDTSIFAPPLYPWLMRGLGRLLGGGERAALLAGLLLAGCAVDSSGPEMGSISAHPLVMDTRNATKNVREGRAKIRKA